jgi:hypothetical protein
MKTMFLRVLEADDKAAALLMSVREPQLANLRKRFEVDSRTFGSVPGSPFAYWVSERVRSIFSALPSFADAGFEAWVGLQTNYDFRWLRLSWECPFSGLVDSWVPFAKGGVFSPFYASIHLRVAWGNSGSDIKNWKIDQLRLGKITANNSRCWNESRYFRPGLTWPIKNRFSFKPRALPAGCIFAQVGPSAFIESDDPEVLSSAQALMSSAAFTALVKLMVGWNFEVGVVQRVPFPELTDASRTELARLARRAWRLVRSLDTRDEVSQAFTLPALMQVVGADVAIGATKWSVAVRAVEGELVAIQAEIDELCFALYGIDQTDRREMTQGFGTEGSEETSSYGRVDAEDDVDEDGEFESASADATSLAAELVSWTVGVALGRFDVRLATGARPMPSEPEPFDRLPPSSPGMLTGCDGLPAALPPAGYPLTFPETGILVDDRGHAGDLTASVRSVFDVVFGTSADRWWNSVASVLDPRDHDLRVWLASSFFEYHLKRYSKSRRKAPILWQLGVPSGRYSVWLYTHRLTRDTFFQLQNEMVGPKLSYEERQLTSLIQNAGGGPSAHERKEIAMQEVLVDELRAMLNEIQRVAPLWNPNLNDGIVLTMAPLWNLVPQYKPWQKELTAKWNELAAGKYDWSHLAMHLWPERVIPKCATDRSLAIAHGLEYEFWVEGADGKWNPRPTPLRSADELVIALGSPAVKAALRSALEAASSSRVRSARGAGIRRKPQ